MNFFNVQQIHSLKRQILKLGDREKRRGVEKKRRGRKGKGEAN